MKLQLYYYDILESTNVTAAYAAQQGACEGTVILAEKQSDGHGRMKRIWSSPKGGLWFSVVLRPHIDAENVAQLTLLSGIAVTQAIRKLYETEEIRIKWPNDLLINGKKVCGILSEMRLDENGNIDYVVVGIGLNVNLTVSDFTNEIKDIATSLKIATNKVYSCEEVLKEVLKEFVELYELWLDNGDQIILPLWRKFNCTLGKKILVKDNDYTIFEGVAVNISSSGALIVCDEEGTEKTYDFGEISIR